MKIRSIKRRILASIAATVFTGAQSVQKFKTVYTVLRKKDGLEVARVNSLEEVQVLIDKAKSAKKAALVLGAEIQILA